MSAAVPGVVLFTDNPSKLGRSGPARFVVVPSAATKADLIERIGAGLSFPEPYGRNWDAFEEMLKRLEWLPGISVIVAHEGPPALSEQDLQIYLAILRDTNLHWASSEGRSFIAALPASVLQNMKP